MKSLLAALIILVSTVAADARTAVTSPLHLYASASGSDSNDCLSTSTRCTLQGAINRACNAYDAQGNQVLVSFTGSITLSAGIMLCDVSGAVAGGYLTEALAIYGEEGKVNNDPTRNVLSCGSQTCFTGVNVHTGWLVEWLAMTGTSSCVEADANTVIYVGVVYCWTSGFRIVASYNGFAELVGIAYATGGNASAELYAVQGGHIICRTPQWSTSSAVDLGTGTFAYANDNSLITCGNGVDFSYYATAGTGWTKFQAFNGGGVETNGVTLPGPLPGAAVNPGW